jgi:hypothetical protein
MRQGKQAGEVSSVEVEAVLPESEEELVGGVRYACCTSSRICSTWDRVYETYDQRIPTLISQSSWAVAKVGELTKTGHEKPGTAVSGEGHTLG